MKKMNRNEMLRYIAETVLTYEKLEITSHILWDYMCDSQKLLDWLVDGRATEPFFIAIRKMGVESGNKDYVHERLQSLGSPIHVIKISKAQDYSEEFDYEVVEQ